MSGFRTATGGLIDRGKPVNFTFDGKSYQGFAGDTLASALLANGVKLVGRSFKYHRPRGILSAGSEEPNALVELRERRLPRAEYPRHRWWRSLTGWWRQPEPLALAEYDLLSVNDLLSPFFAAGFYYKTFMWPAEFWEKLYEPMIRRAAGLGRNAGMPDPDTYEKTTEFCDVLVIGGGADGVGAAREAAATGARVVLCDENAPLAPVELPEGVKFLPRTTVFGVYDGGTYAALERLDDHLPVSSEHAPPAPEPRSSPGAASSPPARSSGRWCSAITTCPA